MEETILQWDGEYTVVRYDRDAGAWVFIAIHSSRLGMPVGGTRLKLYNSPRDGLLDAQRLAAGMTYKWAAIDFPLGGGKGVIALSHPLERVERERLLERYGALVESLRGGFGTGADLGVGPAEVDTIARRTRYVFCGAPGEGGSGDPGPWTSLGVHAGMQAAAGEAFGSPDLKGRTVLIQGTGDVGVPLARRLAESGAKLKLADVEAGRARALAKELGTEVVAAERVYGEPCDIFAPCAVGGVLNAETIPKLRCRVVAGSANNQLETPEDAERLHEHGILYAPDFIINAGGAIAFGGIKALGMSETEARERILAIGATLKDIFMNAEGRGESSLHAAERLAQHVLQRG